MPRVCVYLGSSSGASPAYAAAARALGAEMAARGVGLVYGGGNVGLMGEIADAVLDGGGEVIGVITDFLVGKEVAHTGLDALEVVGTMHERKARMADLADGFVVLPGGLGTLDETFEILTWTQLGLIAKPTAFLDVAGFWSGLLDHLGTTAGAGFLRPEHLALVRTVDDPREALEVALGPAPLLDHKWLDRDVR